MRLTKTLILVAGMAALLLSGCKKERPHEIKVKGRAPQPEVVVVKEVSPGGKQQMKAVDPQMAEDVNQALNELVAANPEPASAADLAAAKDPGKLLGKWEIVHTVHSTNGKKSPPSLPLARTVWTFEKDGRLSVLGGMKIDLRYVYTGDRLILTGLGPKQDYRVVELTDRRLEVTVRIEAGTTLIENTTVLKKL
jgi:hypothetical protein